MLFGKITWPIYDWNSKCQQDFLLYGSGLQSVEDGSTILSSKIRVCHCKLWQILSHRKRDFDTNFILSSLLGMWLHDIFPPYVFVLFFGVFFSWHDWKVEMHKKRTSIRNNKTSERHIQLEHLITSFLNNFSEVKSQSTDLLFRLILWQSTHCWNFSRHGRRWESK